MKMSMKKLLAVVLALVFVASCFAACGTKADGGSKEKTIKIGSTGPLTGDAAGYGQAVKNGAELAVKEINAAGGINGIKVEFNMADDEASGEKSVNAYNNLKDWGMQFFAGTVTSGACLAVIGDTKADNMFQLTPSASSADCVKNDNAFRICFGDPDQGVDSANYIFENKLAEKVAVIYNNGDEYSKGIYDAFKAQADKIGLNIVSAQAFTNDSNKDFSVQLGKAKASGADLVFLPIYYQEASLILSQAKSSGYSPKFFGCDGLDGILNLQGFDLSLAENVMLLTPFSKDAQDDSTKAFVDAYNKAGYDAQYLNQFAADSYDAIYTIKAAAEKANINVDMSVSQICDAMKTAMTQITVKGVTGTEMTWAATGEVNKAPKIYKIIDGSYTAL